MEQQFNGVYAVNKNEIYSLKSYLFVVFGVVACCYVKICLAFGLFRILFTNNISPFFLFDNRKTRKIITEF